MANNSYYIKMDGDLKEKAIPAVIGLIVGLVASFGLGKVLNKCCCDDCECTVCNCPRKVAKKAAA
jgi:hypothetical protein